MYHEKNKRICQSLLQLNCDLAFIVSPVHIHYYTGFKSDPHERFYVLIYDVKQTKTYLFLPELDYEKAKNNAKVDYLIPVSDTDNGYDLVNKKINIEVNTIAVEKEFLTVKELENLKTIFPNSRIVGLDKFIAKERLHKNNEEIKHVKKAIGITEKGLAHIIDFVKVGMTEVEIKMELEFYLNSLGAEQMAFDTLVLTGENSALPHGVSGLRKVALGDFLLFDFGVTIDGYHSDITRTFIVGKGTDEQRMIYEAVKEANKRAIAAVIVGQAVKDIDRAARDYIENASYGKYFTHRTGHGLGLDVHEAPSIHGENNLILSAGMLFTVEPGIYVPNLGGVRIEDNIYINESGKVDILTSYSKDLTYIKG